MAAIEKKLSESERKLVKANERNQNLQNAHKEALQNAKCKEALQRDKSAIASKLNCINWDMLANKWIAKMTAVKKELAESKNLLIEAHERIHYQQQAHIQILENRIFWCIWHVIITFLWRSCAISSLF